VEQITMSDKYPAQGNNNKNTDIIVARLYQAEGHLAEYINQGLAAELQAVPRVECGSVLAKFTVTQRLK
jgi:hypothetical protein